MKILKGLIAVFLILILCMTGSAAFWSTSPPKPPVDFPFDVSRRDSTVNKEISIREYRSYYFALQFDCLDRADYDRVMALVGDGGRYPDGRYGHPDVIVPIHIKLIRLETGKNPETVYDGTVETQAIYAGISGALLREIIVIDLKPGIYRVEASTIKDSPAFTGTSSHLFIQYHPNLKFMPNRK
jgi:hypothetical protein